MGGFSHLILEGPFHKSDRAPYCLGRPAELRRKVRSVLRAAQIVKPRDRFFAPVPVPATRAGRKR